MFSQLIGCLFTLLVISSAYAAPQPQLDSISNPVTSLVDSAVSEATSDGESWGTKATAEAESWVSKATSDAGTWLSDHTSDIASATSVAESWASKGASIGLSTAIFPINGQAYTAIASNGAYITLAPSGTQDATTTFAGSIYTILNHNLAGDASGSASPTSSSNAAFAVRSYELTNLVTFLAVLSSGFVFCAWRAVL